MGSARNQAQRQHQIPLDVVAAIHRATRISVAELVMAFFQDAGYGDLLPYQIDPDTVAIIRKLLMAAPAEQALLTAWLDWLRYNATRP
jgi:hypothetical protein